MEEEKPIGKTERCQRKKKRKPEEIADVEVKRREPIKEGWSQCQITEEQSKSRVEQYSLDLATRKVSVTLTTAFSRSERSRSQASEV